jgi:hypothetical protein
MLTACATLQLHRPQVHRPCPHRRQPEDPRQPPRALQGQEVPPPRPPRQEDPCYPSSPHSGASHHPSIHPSIHYGESSREEGERGESGVLTVFLDTCSTSEPLRLSELPRRRSTSPSVVTPSRHNRRTRGEEGRERWWERSAFFRGKGGRQMRCSWWHALNHEDLLQNQRGRTEG